MGEYFVDTVKTNTSGTVELRFYEPGALVPALAIMDSVTQGAIDSGYTSGGYAVGKLPQAPLFGTVPFGPSAGLSLAWFKYGGGQELYDKMYEPFNIKGMRCFMFSPEGAGWFRKEINSLEDLKGLKMRIAGFAANVLERFGVSTQLLAGGDIYPALELGTIDATEYSMPAIDLSAGFHNVAKYYYMPGWHQQITFHEFIVNMDLWKELSDLQRAQLRTACEATQAHSYADAEAINPPALAELEKQGAEIRVFPKEVLDELEAAWIEVAQEQSDKHPEFKEAWDSLSAFRKQYDSWADRAYLK